MLKRIKNRIRLIVTLLLVIIVVIIVLLGLIQVASALYARGSIKEAYDNQFKQMQQLNLLKVSDYTYNQGLFSSDLSVKLSINKSSLNYLAKTMHLAESGLPLTLNAEDYTITYKAHIGQGLFAGILNHEHVSTLAYAKGTIIYPDKLNKLLNKFFNGGTPITVINITYLNGTGLYKITSPAFNYEEELSGVLVRSGGLSANINYNQMFNSFATTLYAKEFSLSAPQHGEFKLTNLNYRGDSSEGSNKITLGDSQLSIGSISFKMLSENPLHFNLNDILYIATGINSTEFLKHIDTINVNNFSLTALQYYSSSKESYGYFSAASVAKFGSLITNGSNYGPFLLNLNISHIPSAAFANLVHKMKDINDSNKEIDLSDYIESLKPFIEPIFVGAPQLDINAFELQTPSGKVKLSGKVSLDGFSANDMQNIDAFEQKLNLKLDFTLPKSLLTYLFILNMRYFLSTNNDNMDVETSQSLTKVINIILNNQLEKWNKAGYIVTKDNSISSKLEMKNGQVTFNGISIN